MQSFNQDQTTGEKVRFGKNPGRRGGKDPASDISSFATMVQGDGKAKKVINCSACGQGHKVEDYDTFEAMDVGQGA